MCDYTPWPSACVSPVYRSFSFCVAPPFAASLATDCDAAWRVAWEARLKPAAPQSRSATHRGDTVLATEQIRQQEAIECRCSESCVTARVPGIAKNLGSSMLKPLWTLQRRLAGSV